MIWFIQTISVGMVISLFSLFLHRLARHFQLPHVFRYNFLKLTFVLMLASPIWCIFISPFQGTSTVSKIEKVLRSSDRLIKSVGEDYSRNFEVNANLIDFSLLLKGLIYIYLLGLGFFLCRIIFSVIKARGLIRRACKQDKLETFASVYSSDEILTPISIGFFNPIIIIPTELIKSLSDTEMRMVIAHEGTHITRKDHLFKALGLFIHGVWYFWPVTWILSKEFEADMELSCDSHLLTSGFFSPRLYGELLVRLSSQQLPIHGLSMLGISNSFLKRRILSMKDSVRPPRKILQHLFMTLLATSSIALSAYAIEAPSLKEQNNNIVQITYQGEMETSEKNKTHINGTAQLVYNEPIIFEVGTVSIWLQLKKSKMGKDEVSVQYIDRQQGTLETFTQPFTQVMEHSAAYSNSDVYKVRFKIKRM